MPRYKKIRAQDRKLLTFLPWNDVGYVNLEDGLTPILIGQTKAVLGTRMNNDFCFQCPLASYSHVLRKTHPHTYEKLCTIPFVKSGKVPLLQLMKNSGCGAKSTDYKEARKLLGL